MTVKHRRNILFCVATLLACLIILSACGEKPSENEAPVIDYAKAVVVVYTANIRGEMNLLPKIAAVKDGYKALGSDVLLVDVGNYLQGSTYSTFDSGKSVARLMDSAGYDVMGVGRREFAFLDATYGAGPHSNVEEDESFDKIANALTSAVVLSANATVEKGDSLVPVFPASKSFTLKGKTVTLVGVTDDNIKNVYFEKGSPVSFTDVNSAGDGLTVLLSNMDYSAPSGTQAIVVKENEGFAIGALVIGADGTILSNERITLSTNENEEIKSEVKAFTDMVNAAYPAAKTARCAIDIPCDAAAARGGESGIGNLITDALLWKAQSGEVGTNLISVSNDHLLSLWNGGNIRYGLDEGDLTLRELKRVVSYPNTVCVMYLTGAQLLEMLEASAQGLPYTAEKSHVNAAFFNTANMTYTVDTTKSFDGNGEQYGSYWEKVESVNRVKNVMVGGKEISLTDSYAVVCSNAVFNGQDSNYISADRGNGSFSSNISVIETVLEYINEELGGVVDEKYALPTGRITIEK